jgi:ribosome-associated protein
MNLTALHVSIIDNVQFAYSRSSGPGGQNVNKVNTKVEARICFKNTAGLSIAESNRAREILASRINSNDELIVVCTEERSQANNRDRALNRLETLIIVAARIPKRRVKTKPSRSSVEKRIQGKKIISKIKHHRTSKPTSDD